MKAIFRYVRENSLTLVFFALFLVSLILMALAGLADLNAQRVAELSPPLGFVEFISSSDFAVDVAENWQSEFLQFTLFVLLTVWLVQKGSPESKPVQKAGTESDKDQMVGEHATATSPGLAREPRSWRGMAFSNSLGLLMAALFLLSWLAQALAGAVVYSEQRLENLQDPVPFPSYVLSADFWSRTLQN